MTVTSTTTLSGPYYPNGATTTFPFGFKVYDKTDLRVFDASTGAEVDYSPTLYSAAIGPQSGSITFTAPPVSGSALYIALDPSFTNNISFGVEESFYPQGHNEGFDRSALRDQVLKDGIDRSFTVPLSPDARAAMVGKVPIVGIDGSPTFESLSLLASGAIINSLNSDPSNGPSRGATLYGINPILYLGYRGDGTSHPLSSVTYCQGQNTTGWGITQWQALFPRATATSEEIDNHAIQRWCDLNPLRVQVDIPPGIGLIDKGIITGDGQSVFLRGAGHDVSFLRMTRAGGTLWTHGYAGHLAAGAFNVSEMSIRTNVIAACAFNVWFSGGQSPWCHIMHNVIFQAENSGQYFQNACITRNIKRGLDWRNIVAYGNYGAILSTDAFLFPANADGTTAGNSYNFDNCMTVGYRYGWAYNSTGFTSASLHCHEEAQFYNCQSYAGVGLFQYLDTNTNTAPDDNWTFNACGWQGTGPCFDMQYLEHIRASDCLLVNDTVTTATDCFGRFVSCSDAMIRDNEIFCITGSNITGIRISGAGTANFKLRDNGVIAYAALAELYYFDASLPDLAVDERGPAPRGTATYANGWVNDQSAAGGTKGQISENRVRQAVLAVPGVNPPVAGLSSWDILPNGDIVFESTWVTSNNNATGDVAINWPGSIFKIAIKSFIPANADATKTMIAPCPNTGTSLSGGVAHYEGLAANKPNLTTRARIVGR